MYKNCILKYVRFVALFYSTVCACACFHFGMLVCIYNSECFLAVTHLTVESPKFHRKVK